MNPSSYHLKVEIEISIITSYIIGQLFSRGKERRERENMYVVMRMYLSAQILPSDIDSPLLFAEAGERGERVITRFIIVFNFRRDDSMTARAGRCVMQRQWVPLSLSLRLVCEQTSAAQAKSKVHHYVTSNVQ